MHLEVDRVLHHALDVLQGAGEHHAGVGLQDGQVDEVVRLQQAAGQLDVLQVGAVAPHRHVHQILVRLDVVELHALLPGHIGNAGNLVALHGVAADGGGLGDDDLTGLGLLHLPDHGPHHLGVGAHGGVRRGGVARVGLQKHHGALLNQAGDAAHQVKHTGNALLHAGLFRQGD